MMYVAKSEGGSTSLYGGRRHVNNVSAGQHLAIIITVVRAQMDHICYAQRRRPNVARISCSQKPQTQTQT